jgi:exodeoxyribonuclease V alpha subunit
MRNYIKGKFKKEIYNSGKGYIIGLIKIKETNDSSVENYINKVMTFTGYFAGLNQDDDYIFYGNLIEHPKYGFQYQVEDYERIKPEDKDGIVEFLSSDLFQGIGEKLAVKIVDTLGKETLDKILEDKDNLKKVPKLSDKKIETIYNTLSKYEESHKIVVYLTELGFNMKDSLNIYNYYKDMTVMTIENNIFDIIEEVEDISFLKVDQISEKLNFEKDDIRRIKACILFIMKDLTFKTGNTYLEIEEIKKETIDYLKFFIQDDDFINFLDELRFEGKIVLENNLYYLMDIYQAEVEITSKIKRLLDFDIEKQKNFDQVLKELEHTINIKYNDEQIEAIRKALENHLFIINGGPGTGKTTIIKAIVSMYQELNGFSYEEMLERVSLLAPTGRASKRMSEATLFPATTIHRFLKWDKDSNSFNINMYNKAEQEFIIVDEVSMIDISLLASLFKGLKENVKIIFVGDYNQLPSVGPGNILKDLIESNMIDTVELNILYRQSEDSYITKLASEIKNNELTSYLEQKEDYAFLTCNGDSIPTNLKNICKQLLEKGYNEKIVQIMAPMYMGINGIDHLNQELQSIFNPKSSDKEEIKYGDVIFREQDKILQLVNMPDLNVYNGDIGYISSIIPSTRSESKKNEIYVNYDGNIVKYLPNDFQKIKHGFIISIHKSQGSEFEFVIMPICRYYRRMLYKKLIYTGITRAKRKLILLGEADAFLYGVSNTNEMVRKTNLKNRLEKMYNMDSISVK